MEVKRTMKVFIYGFNRNAEICIYGISGEEETEKFLTKFFADKGLYLLSEEEKKNITPMPNMRSAKKAMKLWLRTLSAYRQRLMQSLMMLSKQNATRMRFTR